MNHYIIFSNASGYGGAEKSLELIVKRLADSNDFITVFAENNSHIESLKIIQGVKVVSLRKGNGIIATIYNLWIILCTFVRAQNSYILTNTNKGAMYLSLISQIYPIDQHRVIVYIRDFQWKYVKFIFRKLSDVNIAVPSLAVAENSKYKDLLKNYDVFGTGNPVASNSIDKIKRNNTLSPYILCLTNISRWKGLDYLLKAYNKSMLWKKGISLQIVGRVAQKDCYEDLVNYVKQNNLTPFVIFKSFVNDTTSLYNECLFVVNSSISEYGGPETFGRTIIEAWSFCKAPISFAVGGPKYIIKNEYNGLLVKEKDIDSLSQAMQKLAFDGLLRNKLAQNGYLEAKRKYTAESVVNKLMKIWRIKE